MPCNGLILTKKTNKSVCMKPKKGLRKFKIIRPQPSSQCGWLTHFKIFFLLGLLRALANSQSLFESESDSGNDSSNSEASSILVMPLVPKDDGSDDAASRIDVDAFGRCNGV